MMDEHISLSRDIKLLAPLTVEIQLYDNYKKKIVCYLE